jgi:DNA-binding protein HU-beta
LITRETPQAIHAGRGFPPVTIDRTTAAGTVVPHETARRSGRDGVRTRQANRERLMNKGQLVEAVATELEMSKAAASRAVDAVMRSITTGIKHDENVTIVGFGSFSKKKRSARTVRNPATGEPMEIQASTTVGFKPSQSLKEELG